MSYRAIVSLISAILLCSTFLVTQSDARPGARGGGVRAGGAARGGAVAYRGGARGGVAYHSRNVAYRGGAYRGGYYRPGWGAAAGAAAVGAAAAAGAAAPYYNNYNTQCGYYPYPPCN